MSRLVPTPIVDVNGRLTTVHKRAEEVPKAHSALAGVKPSLGAAAGSKMHTIKPRNLPALSDAIRLGKVMGAFDSEADIDNFRSSSNRVPVTMSDDEIYDALRCGIQMQDMAALKQLGLTAEAIVERTSEHLIVGGSLTMISGRGNVVRRTKIQGTLDRLQASGTSALEADKLMGNGLQDGHFDRALNDDQVKELFSKWRFRSEAESYEHDHVEQDDIIDGFLSGRLPFEVIGHKLADLKNSEVELYSYYDRKLDHSRRAPYVPDAEMVEKLRDLEYRTALVDVAALSLPQVYSPLKLLDELVQNHGMEALKLNDPRKASMKVFVSAGVSRECGVEAAKYVEEVLAMASNETEADFWGTSPDSFSSQGVVKANGNYLRNWELIDLYEKGVPAEVSYDLIVKHGLTASQILTARETGVGSTLANGVL